MPYRYVEEEINQQPISGKYKFIEEEKQPLMSEIGRHAGRTFARGLETFLGAPRAIGEFGEMLVPEKGIETVAEKIGLKEPVEKGFELAKKYAPYKLLPSSEEIRKNVTQHLFGEKLEPKSPTEAKADEITSDFVALALPNIGGELKLIKPLAASLGGAMAKEFAERGGLGEKGQTYVKLGTMIPIMMFNPKGAEKYKNQLYDLARKARPANATVSTTLMQNEIPKLRTSLSTGGIPKSAEPALKLLDDLETSMQGAQIPLDALERFKINLNEVRSGIYKQLEGNKPGIKRAHEAVNKVAKIADDALQLYGKQNPQWNSYFFPANEAHGAIAQSKKVRDFIKKKGKKISDTTLGLFGIEMLAKEGIRKGALAKGVATAALGITALTGGELLARIFKSPTLRKYYFNVLKDATKENSIAVSENLQKLDVGLSQNRDIK